MSIAVAAVVAAVVFGAVALVVLKRLGSQEARASVSRARAEASAAVRGAKLEAAAARRAEETAAREEVLELRVRADEELAAAHEELARRQERLQATAARLAEAEAELDRRAEEQAERQRLGQSVRDRAAGLERDVQRRAAEAIERLEHKVGRSAEEVKDALEHSWLEEARAETAQRVRSIDGGDPQFEREARRLMDIAVSRYQNHFLTERTISNLRVGGQITEILLGDGAAVHEALQQVANVQLNVSEDGESVRLEGLDGVGREIARRALSRLAKKQGAADDARRDPTTWATKIRTQLEREIQSLGKKAFSVLEIPRSHPEIVTLVGKLNYRTSYTQNQWLHAVEASFLAGMIASEMRLDVKLARRATLMHDIGKALTHEIDGSHAVIGADIARRLGEEEVVANAIGAHHADEPPNSVYAYLVAAADAMSGARPGARREMSDGYNTRLHDLERIGAGFRGVDRAFAVHGGRELRVYVREGELSDLDVVELSAVIAERVSDEMTFPGQIKVTVIRAYEAVATAS